MTEREKNLAICHEMEQKALYAWGKICDMVDAKKINIKDGTYTPFEIDEMKPNYGNLDMEMATVEVGRFRCEFPICESFRLLHQFYVLSGVKKDDRKRFSCARKKEAKATAGLTVEARHKVLEKMVCNDNLRPNMQYIYIDLKERKLVATDGFILAAMPANITAENTDSDVKGIYLHPKSATLEGTCQAALYADGECRIGNDKQQLSVTIDEYIRFPNYHSVMDDCCLSEERHFAVTREGVNIMESYLKMVKSQAPYSGRKRKETSVDMYFQAGEQVMHLRYKDADFDKELVCDVPLERSYQRNMQARVRTNHLLQFISVWNGHFWYANQSKYVVFDSDSRDTFIINPLVTDENFVAIDQEAYTKDRIIGWRDRFGYLDAAESQPTEPEYGRPKDKPIAKKKPTKKPSNKPIKTEIKMKVNDQLEQQEPTDITTYSGGVTVKRSRCIVGSHFFPLLEVRGEDGAETLVAGTSLFRCISDKDGEIQPEYAELFRNIDAFVDDHLLIADPLDEEAICRQVNQFIDMLEDAAKELDKHNIKVN